MQLVLIQFLGVRPARNTCTLGRSCDTSCIQGKMHTVKSAEHGYRVIAPQSAVTPNDILRYAHDPARDVGVPAVDKLPSLPVLVSSGRACLIRVVVWAVTEFFFVTVVLFAREKGSAAQILTYIGFEGPVLIRA